MAISWKYNFNRIIAYFIYPGIYNICREFLYVLKVMLYAYNINIRIYICTHEYDTSETCRYTYYSAHIYYFTYTSLYSIIEKLYNCKFYWTFDYNSVIFLKAKDKLRVSSYLLSTLKLENYIFNKILLNHSLVKKILNNIS